MKKVLILLCVLFCIGLNTSLFAQSSDNSTDEYLEAFKQYVELGGGRDRWNMKEMLDTKSLMALARISNKKLAKKKYEKTCEELVLRYQKEQMLEDFLVLVMPSFKKHVSLEELNELIELYSVPATQTAVKNTSEASQRMTVFFLTMFSSEKREIKVVNCPESYTKACREYCDAMGLEKRLAQQFDAVGKNMQFSSAQDRMAWNTIVETLSENVFNIWLNSSYGFVTGEDFQTLTRIERLPATQHVLDGYDDFIGSDMNVFSMKFAGCFMHWLNQEFE